MLESFINRIADRVITLGSQGAFQNITGAHQYIFNARSYSDSHSFAQKGYNGNVYVYGIIKQKSEWAGAVPWKVYEVRDEKALSNYVRKSYLQGNHSKQFQAIRKKAYVLTESHEANEILEEPNSMQSAKEYNSGIFAMKDIAGETFELGVSPDEGGNKFVRMYFMAPWDMKVCPGPDFMNPISHYEHQRFQGLEYIDRRQVLHSKYFNPDDFWRGLSPMQPAIHSVLQNSSLVEWGQALAEKNGYVPSVLTYADNDERFEQNLRDKIDEQQRDPSKAGTPVTVGNIKDPKVLNFTQSMKDADAIKQIQMSSEQISVAFNWPKELIGGDKKFSNFEQARKYAYQIGIIPMLDDRRDELNRFHKDGLLEGGKYYIDYDLTGVEALQEQADEISKRVLEQWRMDVLTLAETREKLGLEEPDMRLADLRYSEMRFNPNALIGDVPEL